MGLTRDDLTAKQCEQIDVAGELLEAVLDAAGQDTRALDGLMCAYFCRDRQIGDEWLAGIVQLSKDMHSKFTAEEGNNAEQPA